MDLQKNLQRLGLSPKQTLVYLACLQLGKDTVLNISKFAGLKRPTTYLILDELQDMGLVSKTKDIKKAKYQAEDPKKLVTELQAKRDMATALLPNLKAIYNLEGV